MGRVEQRQLVIDFDELERGMIVYATGCRLCGEDHRVKLVSFEPRVPVLDPDTGKIEFEKVWVAEPTPHIVVGVAEAGFGIAGLNVKRGTIFKVVEALN